jgi:hypothetical protein
MNNQILEEQLISNISDQCKFTATSIQNVADQLARPKINKFTLIPPHAASHEITYIPEA